MEGLRTNYRRKLDSFDSLGSRPTNDPLLCFAPYIKKLYTIPDWPALTIFLKSYLWIFFGLYCWFVHLQNDFSLAQFYAVISNQIKPWSHLEKFVVWVLEIISRIIIIYVETLSQCIIPFQSHSHGNSFISKFGRPVHFVLGHFDNSQSHLDTKEHLSFFSIPFYWLSTSLNAV